jgi:AcrR family transcriptional regulator
MDLMPRQSDRPADNSAPARQPPAQGVESPGPESPLRRRRREATELEIAEAAVRLFIDQGYEATTVEQIAAAAGVSPRTFYHYCGSKDNALAPVVIAGSERFVEMIADAPTDRPLAQVISAAAISVMQDQAQSTLRRDAVTIMLTTPALRFRWLGFREWQADLTPVLAHRFGWPTDALQPSALAALIAGAVNFAVEHSARTGAPLAETLAGSVGLLEPGLSALE